jgi:hypothetical protein
MRNADLLADFVRDALSAGTGRDGIRKALLDAGWAEGEADTALAAWSEQSFTPPVPRPRPFISARDAFVYGMMFVALVLTTWHFAALLFELIDLWLPVPGERYTTWSAQSVRWSIATLAVFFPLLAVLNTRANRRLAIDPAERRSVLRKWFVYLTLFVASLTVAGDLVYAIYSFLNGDLTPRFALKLLTVAATAGGVLFYFRPEALGRDAV